MTGVSFLPMPAHQLSLWLNTRANCSNTSWSSCSLDDLYCFFRFRHRSSRATIGSSNGLPPVSCYLSLNFAHITSYSVPEMVTIFSFPSGSSLIFSMRKNIKPTVGKPYRRLTPSNFLCGTAFQACIMTPCECGTSAPE